MVNQDWQSQVLSLFDHDGYVYTSIPGLNLEQQLDFLQQKWDEVDAFYLDNEIIGA